LFGGAFEGLTVYQIILFVWSFLLDLVVVSRLTGPEKDLEIALLRQQLRIVERQQVRGPTIPRWQKIPLVALARPLNGQSAAVQARHPVEVASRLGST
jgi:hypothetical protein